MDGEKNDNRASFGRLEPEMTSWALKKAVLKAWHIGGSAKGLPTDQQVRFNLLLHDLVVLLAALRLDKSLVERDKDC